ncbi:hypothetical protein H4CHR_02947 [Variovorax sp. PBS-H4]|uniref:hypothetical protein n=1 Tax=Variovorax sp. PBS-H4 TaxID=434008 RepID=UPI0013177C49|nr:hypothetical protein [Variovorax sp. PBS-H4]VTU32123.1 hypothetical protein H4CHR_02947 [Variovorax sp. PBS-H4]
MTITPDVISDLRELHKSATPGKWAQGATSHHTVAYNPGTTRPACGIAEFTHSNDASFCDAAHAWLPALLDEIERLRAMKPVAVVRSYTNGSYHRNYKLEWLTDVPEGTRLLAEVP